MAFLFANNASTVLASGISAGQTIIPLSAGSGVKFPSGFVAPNVFLATLSDAATGLVIEIVQVTSATADAMTVVRGFEGTTAKAYNTGDFFSLRVTAGQMNSFLVQAQADARYAVLAGSAAQAFNTAALTTTGVVTIINSTTAAQPVAQNQTLGLGNTTWVDVTASRFVNTSYTNAQTRPLMVIINTTVVLSSDVITFVCGGVTVATISFTANGSGLITAIVPPGAVYRLNNTGSGGRTSWVEL